MTNVRLADDFLDLFPDAQIGLVHVTGIDNRAQARESAEILNRQIDETAALLSGDDFAALPAVAPWREAYARFGVKPSKTRSSIENLLRSAKSGRLRSINPLVDLYNSISLAWQLPVGGEDLDQVIGDIVLTRAAGAELFIPLGSTENESPPAGAVIYRDDIGVLCSCWNWREADRTKLTGNTVRAVLVVESIPPLDPGLLELALDALANRVVAHLGGATRIRILNRQTPEATLGVEGLPQ